MITHDQVKKVFEETIERVKHLEEVKGGEYSRDTDRLANFRGPAEALNIPMEAVWYIFADKHWDAVGTYVRDLLNNKDRMRSESIESRLDDIITYAMLMKCILKENEKPITPLTNKFTEQFHAIDRPVLTQPQPKGTPIDRQYGSKNSSDS